jgi:TRAP-type C4-dicarboxylate transport system substrate-binding protein
MKIRTQEHPGQIAMMKGLGAAPTPIPWVELYTALQTGVVDGQENALPTINLGKLYEVQDYLTFDNHIYGCRYFLVNGAWWKKLPKEYREMFLEAGRQASVAARGLDRILEWELLARLKDAFKEVYLPTSAEMKGFREKAVPAYLGWYHKNVDREKKWSDKIFKAASDAEKAIWGWA